MKVLAFVDTHGVEKYLKRLIDNSKEADVLVCAGDFTVFENGMENVLKMMNSIGKPVILVNGNHESPSSVMNAAMPFKNIHFIHNTHYRHGDYVFFGYGGGGFVTEDSKFPIVADNFIKNLKDMEKKDNKSYKIVFVTHAPPYGTKLDDLEGHVGVKEFTKFIIEEKPVLVVSGHLHENIGTQDKINDTVLINPGPAGKLITL